MSKMIIPIIILSIGIIAFAVNLSFIFVKASTYEMVPTYNEKGRVDNTQYAMREHRTTVSMSGNYPLFIISLVALPVGITLFVMEKEK